MTREEAKAKELIEKVYKSQLEILGKSGIGAVIEGIEREIATNSVLIVVEEILNNIEAGKLYFKDHRPIESNLEYWQKIKEILTTKL